MSRGVNKVIIIGNLGKDPEVRYTPSGDAIANLTIATSEEWKDRETGEKKSQTEWHKVVFYGRVAQVCGEYLQKGSKVYVEGSLRTRKWQDKDGNDRYTTEIKGAEMQMLDGSRSDGGEDRRPQQSQQRGPQMQSPQRRQSQPAMSDPGYDEPAFDDDIPF